MVFQPGKSGNPLGYNGGRRKGTREAFQAIKDAGYIDPLVNLAKIQHESENEGIRASAAASLLGYCHPKLQSVAIPRFIATPIDVPDFQTIEDAERFLARLPVMTARGELDFQSALELSTMAKTWIDAKTASDIETRLLIIEETTGIVHTNGAPAVLGGLPRLPGCDVIMPGSAEAEPPATNDHDDKPQITGPGPTNGAPDHEP